MNGRAYDSTVMSMLMISVTMTSTARPIHSRRPAFACAVAMAESYHRLYTSVYIRWVN